MTKHLSNKDGTSKGSTMANITAFSVEKLFGYVSHRVEFEEDGPTILTAPNGAGKTHVLSLLRAGLAFDLNTILILPFLTFQITFEGGDSISFTRREIKEGGTHLNVSLTNSDGVAIEELNVTENDLQNDQSRTPAFIRRTATDRWINQHTGKVYNRQMMSERYGLFKNVDEILAAHEAMDRILKSAPPVLIDTKRLDSRTHLDGEEDRTGRPSAYRAPVEITSKIREYIGQLKSEVVEARRKLVQNTQRSDVSFPERALEVAHKTVNKEQLKERYIEVSSLHQKLSNNMLAVGEVSISFPEDPNPTIKRIFDLFVSDWNERLEPLIPLNNKIQTLRDILDGSLAPTGKRTAMSESFGLEFLTNGDRRIPVDRLSSGEQHLIALYTMLLFSAERGSVVLIDEPEISFHASWQHAFLKNIRTVSRVNNLQVIVATHSTAIINGNWELTRQLHLAPIPEDMEFDHFDTLTIEGDSDE